MRTTKLPRTVKVNGCTLRLHWQTLATGDGWYAEVSPRKVRQWEQDPNVHIDIIEHDLKAYCDYTRYGQDKAGSTYLCLYIRA